RAWQNWEHRVFMSRGVDFGSVSKYLQVYELMSLKLSFVYPSLALLSVLLAPASLTFAQHPAVDFTQLEKVAFQELKETNTPGESVGVVSGGRLALCKKLGGARIQNG